MGVRIIENVSDGLACLYDSVSDVAFGPVFYDLDPSEAGESVLAGESAEAFLGYLKRDARTYDHAALMDEYGRFRDLIERDGWNAVAYEEATT